MGCCRCCLRFHIDETFPLLRGEGRGQERDREGTDIKALHDTATGREKGAQNERGVDTE